jgi:hypothetical protein
MFLTLDQTSKPTYYGITSYQMHATRGKNVATLTLDLQPKQGFAKVRAKNEAQESHFMIPKV